MSDLILILDDELNYATMVSDLLVQYGYQTDVCTQPREALDRLHQQSYGLIITDYKMPEVDGAKLLSEVRKVLPYIPVIMISGLMGKSELLRVANIGVTLILEKPFDVPSFLEHVSRFVNPSDGSEGVDSKSLGTATAGLVEMVEYPAPATSVVDESLVMRQFLNRLWGSFLSHSHHILIVPKGGEFEALTNQVAEWMGTSRLSAARLSLPELSSDDVLAALCQRAADPSASPLVAVTVPDPGEVDLVALERFFRWSVEPSEGRHRLRFLYALPDVIEARQFIPPTDLDGIVSAPMTLPPLRDRLIDISVWVERTLAAFDPDRRRPLTAEAVEMILHYDWSGNHHELVGTIRRAVALARRGEVTATALRNAMAGRHMKPPSEEKIFDLAGYLRSEQSRYLEQFLPKKDRFAALTRLAGKNVKRLRADQGVEDQPLIFTELTEITSIAKKS